MTNPVRPCFMNNESHTDCDTAQLQSNMTIAVGEKVPEVAFPYIPYESGLDDLVRGADLSLSGSSTQIDISRLAEPVGLLAEFHHRKDLTADA